MRSLLTASQRVGIRGFAKTSAKAGAADKEFSYNPAKFHLCVRDMVIAALSKFYPPPPPPPPIPSPLPPPPSLPRTFTLTSLHFRAPSSSM
jgi:hypothetical protein